MRLTITQPALSALIERGGATAAKNSPLFIINHVRLIAEGETLRLASTDQDRFAEAIVPADVVEPGAICVPFDKLKALVAKHGKSSTLSLTFDDERLVVSGGRSTVKLPTVNADDFPKWADAKPEATFVLPAKDLARAFGRVRFAASTEDTKYYLQGVHLDYHDGVLHFVATDGHRLAVSGMPAPAGSESCPKAIVPSEGVDAAALMFKDAADITVAVGKNAISFSANNLRLSSRLIEGTFPAYERIIPDKGSPGLIVKRADFVDCLDRANVLVGEGSFSAIIARPDGETLRLESRNQGGGAADEELPATIDEGFEPFGFNPKYAAQFLATLTVGSLTVEQSDPNGPHLIYSEDAPDFVGVLMPMRVAA